MRRNFRAAARGIAIHNVLLGGVLLGGVLLGGIGCSSDSSSAIVFEVLIENTATPQTLTGSDGQPVPIVFSPGVFAVHTGPNPFFTPGQPAPDNGLEAFAEDGEPADLSSSARFADGVRLVGLVSQNAAGESSLLVPGFTYRFLASSDSEAASLSLVLQFLQSNDIIVSTPADGIPLFDGAGNPLSGDITPLFTFFDAGTEVNEEIGLGPSQPANQTEPNQGAAEGGVVTEVAAGAVPAPTAMLRITINPVGEFDQASPQ